MNEWYCCLLCEGSSDAALTNVLELLLTRLTSEPASVSARLDLKGSVREKLLARRCQWVVAMSSLNASVGVR